MRKVVGLAFLFAFGVLPPVAAQAQSMLFRVNNTVAGPTSEISAASINDEQFVTGNVVNNGLLTMTAWNVTQNGTFSQQGTKTAFGTAPQFVLVNTGATGVVSVVKSTDKNQLKLIDWAVSASGGITRQGSVYAGPIVNLAAAAVGDTRILTGTQDSTGATKLIVWDLNANGTFTRDGSITTSAGTTVAVAVLSPTVVASAIRNKAGNLEVSTFSLNASGNLTALGAPATGAAISTVSAVGTSLDRFVTAARLANGNLDVTIWTGGNTGPTLSSHETAGAASEISVAAISGVKVVTALRQQDGTLGLISWKVSGNIERLSKITAGAVGPIAMTVLGWDRIVTPVQEQGGKLDIIDWGDASMGMLQSSWDANSPAAPSGTLCGNTSVGPMGGAPFHPGGAAAAEAEEKLGTADDEGLPGFARRPVSVTPMSGKETPIMILSGPAHLPDPVSPPPSPVFHPDIWGVDPMVAVGKEYVIATEDHMIEFFPKTGSPVTQLPSTGAPTCITSTQFFAGFTRPLNADNTVNRSNIDLYQRFPANFGTVTTGTAPNTSQLNLQCDPTDPTLPQPCINEFYDTRVTYDPYSGHFIIVSAARGVGLGGAIQQEEIARRYIAIAISRTEDPRDGFNQWMTTESSYLDWPFVATANGVIVTSHFGCVDTDTGGACSGSPVENVPLSGRHQRPAADVYNMADMTAATPGDSPRNWKIESYQTGAGSFIPVTHHGSVPGNWTFLAQPVGGLTLWGFVQPAGWDSVPALKQSTSSFTGGMNGFGDSVTYQNGNIYFAGADLATAATSQLPGRYRVRGMRIAVTSSGSSFSLAACPGNNCLDFTFGQNDGDDAPGDLLSYELPSMAVDAAGDMVVVHGRVPLQVAQAKGQEARYRVYYNSSKGLQDGAILNLGSPLLTYKPCANNVTQSNAIPENIFHIQYTNGNCPSQPNFQDYASAFADPNGTDIWMAHAFAVPGGYQMVIGKVTP